MRLGDRALRGRADEGGVLGEDAVGIFRFRRFPFRQAMSEGGVVDFDFQLPLVDVDMDGIALVQRSNWTAERRFR